MLFTRHCRHYLAGLSFGLLLSCLSSVAKAGIDVGFYFGRSSSQASDVHLSLPGNTDLTFADVSWDDKSFENPLYWGLRLTYWLPRADNWGVALDFTHAKIHANLNATVHVSGIRAGSAVNAQEPLNNTFGDLAMSHGFNLLTLNAIHRWPKRLHTDSRWLSGLTPYVGVGAGIAYPHVEVTTGGSVTDEYQLAGWVLNGLAGINYALSKSLTLFSEYKLSYADMHADLNGGGGLDTKIWTNHFNLGMTYHFGQAPE